MGYNVITWILKYNIVNVYNQFEFKTINNILPVNWSFRAEQPKRVFYVISYDLL